MPLVKFPALERVALRGQEVAVPGVEQSRMIECRAQGYTGARPLLGMRGRPAAFVRYSAIVAPWQQFRFEKFRRLRTK